MLIDFVEEIREKYDREELNLVKQIIIEGIEDGIFQTDDPELTASSMLSAMKGLETSYSFNNDYESLSTSLNELIRLFIKGLKNIS